MFIKLQKIFYINEYFIIKQNINQYIIKKLIKIL